MVCAVDVVVRVLRRARRRVRHLLVLVLALSSLGLSAQPAQDSAAPTAGTLPLVFRSAAERPAPPLPVEPFVPASWSFDQGARLRPTLQRWARAAGWQLLWRVDGDVELQVAAKWSGTFPSAVRSLVAALPPGIGLKVELNTGITPPLVVVDRQALPATQTPQ
jgi:hypothetical protein